MGGCVALVVAGGRGLRFGGDVPKQYRDLSGRAVIARSLAAFAGLDGIAAVRPVIDPSHQPLYDAAVAGLDLARLLPPVAGGASRQESVRLGLESLEALAPDTVLIHDAARPLVDRGLIGRTIAALASTPAALPAVAVADTLKRGDAGRVTATVSREGLWRAQTPQGFRFADILAAHRRFAGEELTDDAALAERATLPIALVAGSENNFKITTEDDLARAGRLIGPGEVRTGLGFDVHRFTPGDAVMLCGVRVPHEAALAGHSDADVGLHALTDALLGAIGAGDIGVHFPPSDARWKGASSDRFLAHAGGLLRQRGGVILNVDVTIVCESPRVSPHRAAMVARIAAILGIEADRVSVKGTTTERLGFTGRGEGIAAQAVVSVRLPGHP